MSTRWVHLSICWGGPFTLYMGVVYGVIEWDSRRWALNGDLSMVRLKQRRRIDALSLVEWVLIGLIVFVIVITVVGIFWHRDEPQPKFVQDPELHAAATTVARHF